MRVRLAAMLLLGAAVALSVRAHEGEDHEPVEAAQRLPDVAPRAAASTDAFEVVTVLAGGRLLVHVDRYATNEAVAGARVEVESDGRFRAEGREIDRGVYAVEADALARPGRHPLTISIEADDAADLVSATLEVGDPRGHSEASGPGAEQRFGGGAAWGAGAALLAVGGWMVARARRRAREGTRP